MSDVDPRDLLGKREDGHLEFKDAEVLRRPVKVAREVVGFLNADGGVVWIGVKEGEQGRAVELQRLENPEGTKRSVLDHLVGVIEPSFNQDEVAVTCVGGLVQVAVKKGAHPPYAVRDGGRHFLTRVDDRLNEMTREQLREAFAKGGEDAGHDLSAIKATLRERLKGEALKSDQLWLGLVPTEKLTIDFSDESTQQLFRTWFAEPNATGNRRGGWNFVSDLRSPTFKGDVVQHGKDTDLTKTTIGERGEVTFMVELSALAKLKYTPQQLLSPQQFEPYALIEYPASVFRLMSKLLLQFGKNLAGAKVLAAFSMKGIRGWTLAPGSPREPIRWPAPESVKQDVLAIDPERLELDAKPLTESPDRCALRLIRLVYGELGFENNAIPSEFDQQQGVLLIR
jgi:hypothetical protein